MTAAVAATAAGARDGTRLKPLVGFFFFSNFFLRAETAMAAAATILHYIIFVIVL